MVITKITTRVVNCEDCEGTGEILDWFSRLIGHSESITVTCEECDGIGLITLQYSECKCGTSEWMHPNHSACSKCIEEQVQSIVNLFLPYQDVK